MRSLIAIAALVASVSASAGELDGKGVVCRDLSNLNFLYPHSVVVGFRFVSGVVEGDQVRMVDGSVAIDRFAYSDETPYRVAPFKISWWNSYELNRKTLELEFIVEGEVIFQKQCEVFQDMQSYTSRLEADRDAIQSELNRAMKGNKI